LHFAHVEQIALILLRRRTLWSKNSIAWIAFCFLYRNSWRDINRFPINPQYGKQTNYPQTMRTALFVQQAEHSLLNKDMSVISKQPKGPGVR